MKSAKKQAAFALGLDAEQRAVALLQIKGFVTIARRIRTKSGEIDLIAKSENWLVFVEVKARKTLDEAAFSLSATQQKRIAAAAELWLSEQVDPLPLNCRFDVILLAADAITHLENAFEMEL